MTDATTLAASRLYCRRLTRRAAGNFYYGLRLMAEPMRSAMFALYAYMRRADDIADDSDARSAQERRRDLDVWQAQTQAVLNGQTPSGPANPLWPAFAEMVRRYAVPPRVFEEMIAGQLQDLQGPVFDSFEQLRQYCTRVAGMVGLASIHIWGFDGDAQTEALAIDRGIAFQLTNILRDLREDAARGRIYLPRQELADMRVSQDDLGRGTGSPQLARLLDAQIARAREFYERSAALEGRIAEAGRPTLIAMTRIYRGLLEKIARRPQCVLERRVSLSWWTKMSIAWSAARSSGAARKV